MDKRLFSHSLIRRVFIILFQCKLPHESFEGFMRFFIFYLHLKGSNKYEKMDGFRYVGAIVNCSAYRLRDNTTGDGFQ